VKLTCREVTEVLISYVDETLEIEVRQDCEAHLSGCPHCKCYLHSYRATIRMTKLLPCEPLPPDMLQRLRKAMSEADRSA